MMRNPARVTLLFTLLLATASSAFAQSAADFYVGLLRRGASAVEAGQYDAAATPLRIAAFGLVETVDHYQTALAYLAIAQDRLGNNDGARDSVRRLVAAERVEKKFAALPLPASVRSAFDVVAKKHLTPADASALASGGTISAPPRTQPVTTTRSATSTQQPAPQQAAPLQTPPQQQPTPTRSQNTPPQNTPPQNTSSQNTPSQSTSSQAVNTQPPAAQAKPQPQTTAPATTKPAPPPVQTTPSTQPKTSEAKPVETKPAAPAVKPPAPAQTTTTAPAPKQPLSAKEIATRIASAERALTNAQLTEARKLYNEILGSPGLDRESLLRVVEGLYRARDFPGALNAFKALGTLKRGEEPYGYYHAVALYETGQYDAAKKTLAAAIPFIEMTPDVVRYRAKIEGAR